MIPTKIMRITVEIRRLSSGILEARPVESGIYGTNLLRGRSLTNLDHARQQVERMYALKSVKAGIAIFVEWRGIA